MRAFLRGSGAGVPGRRVLSRSRGPSADRPEGPLVWVHAGRPSDRGAALASLSVLADALADQAAILLTDREAAPEASLEAAAIAQFDAATPGEVRRFVDAWRPDAALLLGDDFVEPALELSRRDIPMVLAHARPPVRTRRRVTLRPEIAMALDRADAQGLVKLGLAPHLVEVTGPLSDCGAPPSSDAATRDAMAGHLAGRPAWLAWAVTPGELTAVLNAHRRAISSAHRLILILAPADPATGAEVAERLRPEWRVARRGADEIPESGVEVLVADRPEELGLWLRLSPVSFLGGTLLPAATPVPDPFTAASLGSAILHGPRVGVMGDRFDRLGRAGATRVVLTEAALGAGIVTLLAPDRAAECAHAGWQLISAGAEATDRAVERLTAALDRRGVI